MKRSRRPGPDVEPILKAIVRTAARLCDARYAHLHLVDGGRLAIAAKHGRLPRTLSLGESLPLSRGSVAGRAVVERRTVHVGDLKVAAKSHSPGAAGLQRAAGLRTMLATPLVQDGRAVGALVVLRTTVRPFTAHQIALLKTFAEQAAIALENARLSRELEARHPGVRHERGGVQPPPILRSLRRVHSLARRRQLSRGRPPWPPFGSPRPGSCGAR